MENKPNQNWLTFDNDQMMRRPCATVNFPLDANDQLLIAKMLAYVDESYAGNAPKYDIRPGIGIAANQLGASKRMFYIHLDDEFGVEHRYLLINPIKISESATKAYIGAGEGCLSVVTDRDGFVIRSAKVTIKGYDYFQQKEIQISAEGILGMCLQHEFDHLEGKLYYDRINPLNPQFTSPEWTEIGRKPHEPKILKSDH